ncbi:hypothetical protein HDV05_002031 [Chytridiales sp. JEL 0842]|nr:hypothetical protein HDV05_002031 [Chytridiales sp. JEL 0842]
MLGHRRNVGQDDDFEADKITQANDALCDYEHIPAEDASMADVFNDVEQSLLWEQYEGKAATGGDEPSPTRKRSKRPSPLKDRMTANQKRSKVVTSTAVPAASSERPKATERPSPKQRLSQSSDESDADYQTAEDIDHSNQSSSTSVTTSSLLRDFECFGKKPTGNSLFVSERTELYKEAFRKGGLNEVKEKLRSFGFQVDDDDEIPEPGERQFLSKYVYEEWKKMTNDQKELWAQKARNFFGPASQEDVSNMTESEQVRLLRQLIQNVERLSNNFGVLKTQFALVAMLPRNFQKALKLNDNVISISNLKSSRNEDYLKDLVLESFAAERYEIQQHHRSPQMVRQTSLPAPASSDANENKRKKQLVQQIQQMLLARLKASSRSKAGLKRLPLKSMFDTGRVDGWPILRRAPLEDLTVEELQKVFNGIGNIRFTPKRKKATQDSSEPLAAPMSYTANLDSNAAGDSTGFLPTY